MAAVDGAPPRAALGTACAVLVGTVVAAWGRPWHAPAFGALAGVGVVLSMIDARTLRLPDRIVGPWALASGLWILLSCLVVTDTEALWRCAAAAASSGILHLTLAWLRPGGLGLGDVKVATVLGAHLGWCGGHTWALGTAVPFLAGGLWATVLVLAGRAHRRSVLAFGPFLFAGAVSAILIWCWLGR